VARKTKKKGKVTRLPKGFEPISGFGQAWPGEDAKVGDMLTGTITDFDEFETGTGKNKRTVQTMKVETSDGLVYTLYESSGLRALFEYEAGTEVAVIYDGMGRAKRGQNAPRLYRLAVK
jgi:hypothetical protein